MSEKTLADYPDLMFKHRAHREPHAVFDPSCAMTDVVAPCCGRITPAATILDLRRIPGTRFRPAGHGRERDHDWGCDGCVDRMIRDESNPWTRSDLLERCGASEAVVLHHRTREHARKLERDDHAVGRAHEPEKCFKSAHEHVQRQHQKGKKP